MHLLSGDTKNVLTGSADNSCRLWDCETGTCRVKTVKYLMDITNFFKAVSAVYRKTAGPAPHQLCCQNVWLRL